MIPQDQQSLRAEELVKPDRVTLFRRFNQVIGQYPLAQLIHKIRNEKYAVAIKQIRHALSTDQMELAQALKKQLPAFTPSGNFVGGRRMQFLTRYQPLIVLDLDDLGEDLHSCQQSARQSPFTRACFTSPSGYGLKILVATDNTQAHHQSAFKQVSLYYEELLGAAVDPSGKDITRLCFMSHDPQAFYSASSSIFSVQSSVYPKPSPAFAECLSYTEGQQSYVVGNRNNFIYLLASNCNRKGILQATALSQIMYKYDLPSSEIKAAVASAYQHHRSEFRSRPAAIPNASRSKGKLPPPLAHKIFPKLPSLLREACAVFSDQRERDVFLTGALTVLSAALPKVKGIYERRSHFPSIYSAIIGAPNQYEVPLTFARKLGMAEHLQRIQKSEQSHQAFRQAKERYLRSLYHYQRGDLDDLPKEPKLPLSQQFFLPPYSQINQLQEQLYQNRGFGVLLELAFSKEQYQVLRNTAQYPLLLRKAFFHEPLIPIPQKNSFNFTVEKPQLSILFSGQAKNWYQLTNLGLTNAVIPFLCYYLDTEPSSQLVFSKHADQDWESYFESLAEEVQTMIAFNESYPVCFQLSTSQRQSLRGFQQEKLASLEQSNAINTGMSIQDIGAICFRLAMILSLFRRFEKQTTEKVWLCEDREFLLAWWLVEAYLKHNWYLQKQSSSNVLQ